MDIYVRNSHFNLASQSTPFRTVYVRTTIVQFNLVCSGDRNVMGRLWEAFVYVNILCPARC